MPPLLLNGHLRTTAEIFYHRPDYPLLLQSYIWQEDDVAPRFPVLNGFLRFWKNNLDGKLHSIWVSTQAILKPTELKVFRGEFTLQ